MTERFLNWENVDQGLVWRAKIPGGWLVRFYRDLWEEGENRSVMVSGTFVPDPQHKWDFQEVGDARTSK